MKLIIAIIQPHKLDDVMRELDEKEIYLKTVTNVLGCGRQKGVTEVYRGVKEVGHAAEEDAPGDRGERQLREAGGGRHRQGSAHGQHRGREDLRPSHGGMHPHPQRRDRKSGHRLASVEPGSCGGGP